MNIQMFGVLVLFCATVGFALARNEDNAWMLVGYSLAASTALQVSYIVTLIVYHWRT